MSSAWDLLIEYRKNGVRMIKTNTAIDESTMSKFQGLNMSENRVFHYMAQKFGTIYQRTLKHYNTKM